MRRKPALRVRIDRQNAWAWQGQRRLRLTPKAFSVLCCLIERAGRLVSKEELWRAVWAGTVVSDAALTTCMREIRRALGERARSSHYIETVHRRGYRWIAPVPIAPRHTARADADDGPALRRASDRPASAARFVGRDDELAWLRHRVDDAMGGQRQLVFVAGEPGIGKSALVGELVARAVDPARVWTAHGQCIEAHGAAEPYMPVLEALARACRDDRRFLRRLRTLAPSWAAQMPAMLSARAADAVRRETATTTPERMVRELAEALDVITRERALILCLEDVHWSDASSLTLLSALAQRPEPARLLVLATYRPVEALASKHPLVDVVRELEAHGRCRTLSLGPLSESNVAAYLAARFHDHTFPVPLVTMLHRRTEGHPLLLVGTVDDLVAHGAIAEVEGRWALRMDLDTLGDDVPATMRHLVDRQRERLAREDRDILAAASLVGSRFAAPLVAAALRRPLVDVEERCARLAEQQLFVRPTDIVHWPDGTTAVGYTFRHAVYQALWRERVGVSAGRAWHRQIAERLEAAHGEAAADVAAELAVHHEAAQSYDRAIRHLRRASANAMARNAPHEAIELLRRGLALLPHVGDATVRVELERDLRIAVARLESTTGYPEPEQRDNYVRLGELCRQAGDDVRLVPALVSLVRFHTNRAEFETARILATRFLRLAQIAPERLSASAHAAAGIIDFHLGRLVAASEHLAHGVMSHDARRAEMLARQYLESVEVPARGYQAVVLWHLGHPAQALASSRAAVAAARALGLPAPIGFALSLAAWLHRLRREPAETRAHAAELVRVATDYGFGFWVAQGTFELGWAMAATGQDDEGRRLMQDGLARYRATGARMHEVGSVMAQVEIASPRSPERAAGLGTIAELLAAVERTGQRCHEPALHRLRGDLLVEAGDDRGAEASFRCAIDVAQQQAALLPELQATTALARRWAHRGRTAQARALLAPIYDRVTEGFDTPDLSDARALLRTLDGIKAS